MAERQLPKLNVAGSIPVSRSKRQPTVNTKAADTLGGLCRKCNLNLGPCVVLPLHRGRRSLGGLLLAGQLVLFQRLRLGHEGQRLQDLRV